MERLLSLLLGLLQAVEHQVDLVLLELQDCQKHQVVFLATVTETVGLA